MTQLLFKTNINCGNCIKSVTPFLNALDNVETWQVNTDASEKILTIETEAPPSVVMAEVTKSVMEAGFKIEAL